MTNNNHITQQIIIVWLQFLFEDNQFDNIEDFQSKIINKDDWEFMKMWIYFKFFNYVLKSCKKGVQRKLRATSMRIMVGEFGSINRDIKWRKEKICLRYYMEIYVYMEKHVALWRNIYIFTWKKMASITFIITNPRGMSITLFF